jgi:hypothetical protein
VPILLHVLRPRPRVQWVMWVRPVLPARKAILAPKGPPFGILAGRGFVHGVVLTRPPNVRTDGTAASLKEARAEFQEVLDGWKAWAKLEEMP